MLKHCELVTAVPHSLVVADVLYQSLKVASAHGKTSSTLSDAERRVRFTTSTRAHSVATACVLGCLRASGCGIHRHMAPCPLLCDATAGDPES